MPRKAPARRGRPPEPDAAYRRIAKDFRRRMRSGELPTGAVLPPWRLLARDYRVGVRVIQRASEALKRDGLLAANAQRRLIARDWDSPGTALEKKLLVLMTTSPRTYLNSPLSGELLLGILSGAGEITAPALVAYDDRLRTSVPVELLEAPLQGVVIMGKIGAQALRGWERVPLPVVLADHPGGNWKLHAAGVDNAGATRDAVQRLLALGHRRIAFVRRVHTDGVHEVEPDSLARQQAFEAAMSQARLSSKEVFSVFAKDTASAPGLAALFARAPRFTAVLAVDGHCANLVLEGARTRGLTVPRDLSIVAFAPRNADDAFVAGSRFDFRELGRIAARLAAVPRHPPRHDVLPGVWVDGKTLGQAPLK